MDPTVIVALLALTGTIISGVISAIISSSLMKYRLEQLEKKVDKHNHLVERMYCVEKDISILKNEVDHIEEG